MQGDGVARLGVRGRSLQVRADAAAAGAKSGQSTFKVAVLGAAGGIGQPLSLLIKMSPLVSELRLYDIANVKGVAADLSHCNTPAQVSGVFDRVQLGRGLVQSACWLILSILCIALELRFM